MTACFHHMSFVALRSLMNTRGIGCLLLRQRDTRCNRQQERQQRNDSQDMLCAR